MHYRYRFLRDKLSERDEKSIQMNLVYSEFLSLECFWYFWQQKYKEKKVSTLAGNKYSNFPDETRKIPTSLLGFGKL